VFVERKNKIPRPKPRFVEYRSMKNIKNEKFLADLSEILWWCNNSVKESLMIIASMT